MIIIDVNGNKRECVKVTADEKWPGYMKVEYLSKVRKGHTYFEWYAKKDFIKNNPQLSSLAKKGFAEWKEDLGRVGSSSNQTLTDKTKKWQTNEFAGYPLWISRGKGEGQIRTIIMNTNDTLVVDKPWETNPDKSSQYVISHNVHNPQVMGNTLPDVKIERTTKRKKQKKQKLDKKN